MKFFQYFNYIPVLFLCSNPVKAIEIKVMDQAGNALSNAVVSIKSPTQESSLPEQNTAVMDQINKSFVPHVLAVKAGTLVNFPNSDDIRHHVYSFSPAKKFQIKLYSGEPSSPIEFDVPGIVVLGCNIHDVMQGYIYVTDTNHFSKTDENGIAQLEFDANQNSELEVWHPNIETINKPLVVHSNELHKTDSSYEIAITVKEKKKFREPKNDLEKKFQSMRK